VSGVLITDELIDKLSAEAEAGYNAEEIPEEMLHRRGGRPPMGRRWWGWSSRCGSTTELRETLAQAG
jgi:hypothetical protein